MDNLDRHIARACEAITNSDTFLITSCESPDGDSIASQLILLQFIRQIKGENCRVDVLNRFACPSVYRFLQESKSITPLQQANPLEHYQVAMMTDGGPERSGPTKPLFDHSDTKILVDHHLVGSQGDCDIELVSSEVSSTCEVLYRFLKIADSPLTLTRAMAEMFYVGIIFDTGSFQYDLTRASTHRIAAELLNTGIDFPKICETVLLECSPTARRLQGHVLCNIHYLGRIAWSKISQHLFKRLKAGPGDMEGLVNMINFTRGVEIAVLFYEVEKNVWKISLRSRSRYNVAQLARSLSSKGGGHKKAAGCTLKGNFRKIKKCVLGALQKSLSFPRK